MLLYSFGNRCLGCLVWFLLVGDTPKNQGFFLDIFMKTDQLAHPSFYWCFFISVKIKKKRH